MAIVIIQEWTIRYKGASLTLAKKMKLQTELEKARVRVLTQKNKKLTSFMGSIQASYVWLYNILDFMVKTHKTPSVFLLTEAKQRHQVKQEIKEYLEQLRQIAPKEDLDMSRQNMQNYIDGPIQIRKMFLFLKRDVKTSSKSLYLDAMEARVPFQLDTIMQFGDVITQYQDWHQYVTRKYQVEVVKLAFPQNHASQCCVLLGYQVVSTSFC